MKFERVHTGAHWESRVGYCRALKAGGMIFVSGTAPVDDGGFGAFAPGDAYAQTKRCLTIIEKALVSLGAPMSAVVRTRLFVTDIRRWEEIGRAHGEFFRDHPPVTTMVEVKSLIDPKMLVEIEAEAIVRT